MFRHTGLPHQVLNHQRLSSFVLYRRKSKMDYDADAGSSRYNLRSYQQAALYEARGGNIIMVRLYVDDEIMMMMD